MPDMETPLFSAHGECSITWLDRFLVIRLSGPFNIEGIIKTNAQISDSVNTHSLEKWARIEVFENDDVLGPFESKPLIKENILHSIDHGCKLIVVINSNNLVRNIFTEFAEQMGISVHFLDELEEATLFASNYLNKINS